MWKTEFIPDYLSEDHTGVNGGEVKGGRLFCRDLIPLKQPIKGRKPPLLLMLEDGYNYLLIVIFTLFILLTPFSVETMPAIVLLIILLTNSLTGTCALFRFIVT